jgi:hypothetical protein
MRAAVINQSPTAAVMAIGQFLRATVAVVDQSPPLMVAVINQSPPTTLAAVDQSPSATVVVINAFPDAATMETIILAAAMGGEIESLLPSQQSPWCLEGGGIVALALRLLWPSSNSSNRDQLEGLHGMEGQGGSGNDEQCTTIWQTSPEVSTRDGQNCKKRCV